ncbi:MAG: alkaline phosphatase family protein [Tidjanibacter sp.]|nr:alkaline phosphatase family protein [Tidjanibacter sp.]
MKRVWNTPLWIIWALLCVACTTQPLPQPTPNKPDTEQGGSSTDTEQGGSGSSTDTEQDGDVDESKESYVVILSMDAFRYDLADMYDTPTLDSIARVGVYSEIMPCFPSNTFPNHYSMATGLHPDHHGIVNNTFFDETTYKTYSISDDDAKADANFYKGEPIWNTVERQGLTAHIYGWVGIDANINNRKPTVAMSYDYRLSQRQLADKVIDAMCQENVEDIPNLVMWYFDEPDAVEHDYSPTSDQTRRVVEEIDDVLAYFMREMRNSPVFEDINFIFTSDHGMVELHPDKYFNIYSLIPNKIQYYYNSNPVTLKPYDLAETKAIYNTLKAHEEEGHYRVWLREDMPEELHYGTYTTRIYPIVLLADTGWKVVYNKNANSGRPTAKYSNHGYNPYDREMHMVFYGCGPAFKRGYTHNKVFQNLNDHLIISHILGIDPATPNDCTWEDIEGLFVTE